MTKKLEVVSNFDPAGTQPEAIKSLVSGIDNGLLHQVLLGVTGSGKTYTMAGQEDKLSSESYIQDSTEGIIPRAFR